MRLHIAESCATKMASYITGRWITLVTLRDTNFVGEVPRFAQDDNALFESAIFMQRDAGADPGFVFIEIDAHHFPLAHPHEIVHENRLPPFGPAEHHFHL